MDLFQKLFASLLATFYSISHNYALAILMLTIVVMLLVAPLTLKSVRSMIILQKVAPELQKLNEKYKNDREKLNAETMAFYKENKINPLSGCLPILLQMPIFIILYSTLNGMLFRSGGHSAPKYLDHNSDLYRDLVASDGKMHALGINLSNHALDKHPSIWAAIPFFVLIFLMVFFQYVQQKQVSARATNTADNPQAEMMKKFTRIMPAFFGVISLTFPAALVLYWTYQSIFRVIQQWAMYKFDPKLKDDVQFARADAKAHVKGGPLPVSGPRKSAKKDDSDKTVAPVRNEQDGTIEAKAPKKKSNKSKSKGR